MNAARKIPNSAREGTYLTVNEGVLLKTDRNTCFSIYEYYPDWLLYTDISGTANGQGLIKMGCTIKLDWIEKKMPLLKEIQVGKLCGREEESKEDKVGDKRKNEEQID